MNTKIAKKADRLLKELENKPNWKVIDIEDIQPKDNTWFSYKDARKNSLANTGATAPIKKCAEEKESKMSYTDVNVSVAPAADTSEKEQRQYLKRRLEQAHYTVCPQAEDFNFYGRTAPHDVLELLAWIKDGKYTLDDKKIKEIESEKAAAEDFPAIFDPFYGITFTDLPKIDREGYNAARKEFKDLYQKTMDKIMILSPAEGLKALQDFESKKWTSKVYTPPKK